LKIKVEKMSAFGVDDVSEEEPGQDESSGYVIDYEQVLKDDSVRGSNSPANYQEHGNQAH